MQRSPLFLVKVVLFAEKGYCGKSQVGKVLIIWENELPNCSKQFKTRKYLLALFSCFFFVGPKTDRMKNGRFGWSYIYIYAPCGDLFPPVGTGRSLAGVWGHTTPTNTASPKKPHLRQPFLNQGQATFSWTPCDPSPPQATKVMKNCDVKEGKEKLGDNFGEKT